MPSKKGLVRVYENLVERRFNGRQWEVCTTGERIERWVTPKEAEARKALRKQDPFPTRAEIDAQARRRRESEDRRPRKPRKPDPVPEPEGVWAYLLGPDEIEDPS